MNLTFLGPIRVDGGATIVLSGAPAYAGVVWRIVVGSGSISRAMAHADAAGLASARYEAEGSAEGDTVSVEADVYA